MALESWDFNDLLRDPEAIVAAQRENLQRAQEMERRIAELTGSATSDDERITVTYTEANGIESIQLDPRVMRMASEDLAAALVQVANAARADMREQMQRVVDETIGEEGQPDLAELAANAAQMEAAMNEFMRDTMTMESDLQNAIDRMKRMAEGG
ncbi:YbaB/EbfC family nucleoid-associated protein [Actinopolymorpha singaporensis]|uniref:YbaB/EbfC DNA-binding family protein n=1 Tax=Actinopolymorpha singaporensis TaxID=117157 RepID=A0A1H1MPG3_9ACTN|nr:YbaB/EbfC family nucleoid-associated protein [Actinopolymorpha singaporensis]SDR88733.1 YbaB/EbfC DNA-binding family protein [Actinopolymorpha singaporensis]